MNSGHFLVLIVVHSTSAYQRRAFLPFLKANAFQEFLTLTVTYQQ